MAGAMRTAPMEKAAGTRTPAGMGWAIGLSQCLCMVASDGLMAKRPPPQRRPLLKGCGRAGYLAAAAALAASDCAYLRRKRSTRPAVSIIFCLPVKNG